MNPRISEVENKGKEAEESSTEVSNEVSNSADSELEDNSDSVDTSSEKSDTSDESKELDSPEETESKDDSESTDENDAPLEAEEAQHEQEQIDEANRAQEESNQEAEQELSDNIEETNQELEQEQEEQQEKLDEANKAQEEEAEKAEQEMSDDIDDANQEIEEEQQEKLDEAEKIDDESNKEAEEEVADELDDADQEIKEAEKDATKEVIEDQEVSEDEPLECSESEADELEEPESDIDDNEQELETVDDTESNEDIDDPEASKEKKLDDSDQEVEYLDDDVKIDDDSKDDGTLEEEPAETNEDPDDKKNNNDLQIEDPGYEDDQDPDVNDEESDPEIDDIQIEEDKTKDNPIEEKVKDGIEEQVIEKPDDYYEREMRSKTFDPNEEFDGNFDKEEYRLDYDEVPKLQLASELDKQMAMIESEVGPNYRNDPAWIELAQRKNELTGINEYNIDPSKKTTFVGVGGESIEKAAGRCIRGKQGRAYNNVPGTCNICSGTNVINQLTHSANNEKCGVDKCMRGPNPFVPYKTRGRFGRPIDPGHIGQATFTEIGNYLGSEGISLREEIGPRNILQKPIDIKTIADQIDNGGTCILGININDTHHHDIGPRVFKSFDYFHNGTLIKGNNGNHAVTVIGYAKDINGNPTGVYVNDTNQPNGGNVVFISRDKFYKMQRHTGGFGVAYCNKK